MHHCVLLFINEVGCCNMSPIATVESVSILLHITMDIGHEWIVTAVMMYSKNDLVHGC